MVRWSKASCTCFIITWEVDLSFTPGVATEVQFGGSPLWELPRLWLLWESPGADESGKCLWENMGCVEQDLPLVHGDLTTSLTHLGLDFQNLGQVWLKVSGLPHRTSPPSWPRSGVCPCRSVSSPKRILANPCFPLSPASSLPAPSVEH